MNEVLVPFILLKNSELSAGSIYNCFYAFISKVWFCACFISMFNVVTFPSVFVIVLAEYFYRWGFYFSLLWFSPVPVSFFYVLFVLLGLNLRHISVNHPYVQVAATLPWSSIVSASWPARNFARALCHAVVSNYVRAQFSGPGEPSACMGRRMGAAIIYFLMHCVLCVCHYCSAMGFFFTLGWPPSSSFCVLGIDL